jgi:hypothetical protein
MKACQKTWPPGTCWLLLLGIVMWCGSKPEFCQAAKGFSQAGTELRIGFWNLRSLEDSSRVRDDIKQMAQILHPMDCVALGELYDDLILGKLVNELTILGGEWNKVRAPKRVGTTLATGERYGFLFRSDKLDVLGRAHVMRRKWLDIPGVPIRHRFEHPPFVCSFTTLDGRLDFTALVVQITSGKDVALLKAKPQPSSVLYQAAEVVALADYFKQVQHENDSEHDIILLGHLRRNVGDESLKPLLSVPGMIDVTSADSPTAIDSPTTYDHIFFQTNFVSEYTGRHGVDKFDETVFHHNLQAARSACSDFRPIWITLRVPDKDDD